MVKGNLRIIFAKAKGSGDILYLIAANLETSKIQRSQETSNELTPPLYWEEATCRSEGSETIVTAADPDTF